MSRQVAVAGRGEPRRPGRYHEWSQGRCGVYVTAGPSGGTADAADSRSAGGPGATPCEFESRLGHYGTRLVRWRTALHRCSSGPHTRCWLTPGPCSGPPSEVALGNAGSARAARRGPVSRPTDQEQEFATQAVSQLDAQPVGPRGMRLPGRGCSLPFFDPIPALVDRRLVRLRQALPLGAIVSLPLLRWRRPPPRRVSRLEGG
jgi:hypothetical protein